MKKFLVFCVLLILVSSVQALSSTEVNNFFKSESHYLEPNQFFSETPFDVKLEAKNYWVIVLLSEKTPTGFIAVPSDKKEVVESSAINRKLFKTAYVLYSINSYKASSNWIFSNSNKGKFDTLSKLLSSDVPFKLNSIKQGSTDSSVRNKIDLMVSMLNSMTENSVEIRDGFDEAISLELSYSHTPNTEDTEKLKNKYNEVFSLLQEFKNLKLDYSLGVIELKKLISDSALIDSSEKQQFLALATEPQQLSSIDSIFSLSEDASQRIDEVYSAANAGVNLWVDNVSSMTERNNAYEELYGNDSSFYSKTKNNFYSLNDAYIYISAEDRAPYWKEQARFSSLKKNFSEAEKAFEQKNYSKTVSSAEKAKADAITIVSAGFTENDNEIIDFGLLIIGLVVVLVLLLLYNNRKKLFKPKEEVTEFKF